MNNMARILVVDDSLMMRKTLRSILEKAGHTVVAESADGEKAVADYEVFQPDLVTLDITMPGMSGIDVTKQIIRRHPEANIVMVSALGQKRMVFEAIESGAKNFIVKPITAETLLSVIELVLGKTTATQANRAATA